MNNKKIGRQRIHELLSRIDRYVVFSALVSAFSLAYYFNPLDNIDLCDWNRTFCPAILSGISIDQRITNYYLLFILYIPVVALLMVAGYAFLYDIRKKYKDYFIKINAFLLLSTIASYFSRYASGSTEIIDNPLMFSSLIFLVVLSVISIIDKEEKNEFDDIVMLFLLYIVGIISLNMLVLTGTAVSHIICMGIFVVIFSCAILRISFIKDKYPYLKNLIYIVLWLPAFVRVALEGLYYFTEKGRAIQRYNTYINRATIVFLLLAIVVVSVLSLKKKKVNLKTVGYIGAITSSIIISHFAYSYQYVWSYSSLANIYELGNGSVAMDTILNGKLPIIDYFSAHALGDVWTKIIYCLIHNDIRGVLVNPYGGFTSIIAFIVLYFIVKELFSEELSLLYVLFFPGLVSGIKWVSVCSVSIAMLLLIYRKPIKKTYFLFWILLLIGAFHTYDEGISIGIACILTYLVMMLIEKKFNNIKWFIISGACVGGCTLVLYGVYAIATGIPVISRIKEWLSVSVGSSSSWATANYGDPRTFAFLFSYFIVPITAILLLVMVIVNYVKNRSDGKIVIITIAYALTEILYISRTIVYHNIAVCSGVTGVLLNYIHWTVSLFVLYKISEKKLDQKIGLISWMFAMIVVIIMEGTVVTSRWPTVDSTLISKSIKASEGWELKDSITDNIGKDRIVYDDASAAFVNQFSFIFDTLLDEDQTYVDFANITSMYLLTGRERPCYVGQTPSLLTDLYSQECYLNQIEEYDCPLAVLGTTGTSYIQQMIGIPHNVRYYKIAEYIYNHYRPLVSFGEFVIWCKIDLYDDYRSKLGSIDTSALGYTIVDYGYDFTTLDTDENGNLFYNFRPYHSFDLNMIPYIWANLDDKKAINNDVLADMDTVDANSYKFAGSQELKSEDGNYIAFEGTNTIDSDVNINLVFYDSSNDGAKVEYHFRIVPGTNQYLIRASQDYFWEAYNIDTVLFGSNDAITIQNVRVLEGD